MSLKQSRDIELLFEEVNALKARVRALEGALTSPAPAAKRGPGRPRKDESIA